ncbi:MAG TPA: PDZ domain-containing protein, partial [Blastocatellia bacterium]|nr:PDZ domain-containing protein [Blastocatellia bacterium]
MKRLCSVAFLSALFLLALASPLAAQGREAKLVRYPHYHQGRVVFTYLADIWTADENGQNVQRITVHKARDVYPRFSPDGRWIAFSSDRDGNLDVFVIPSGGGTARQLTFHSADDSVLGWSPDSRSVLFGTNRGEDFMGRIYTVSVDGGLPRSAGSDMGVYATYSPDGKKLAINRKSQVYWRKYYRGSFQSDVTVMDVASKKFSDVTDFEGMDTWPMWGHDGHIYFVSDREGKGLTNLWRAPEDGGKAERVTSFSSGDVRWPAMSADGRAIVFEHDFGIWKLDVGSKKVAPIKLNIAAETQENLGEVRDFNSQVDDYDLAPSGRRIAFSIHGEIFTAPVEEGDLRQVTDGPARDKDPAYSPDGKWLAFISDRSGREEIYLIASDGAGEPVRISDIDALKNAIAWSPNSKEIAFTSSDNKLRKYSVDTKQTAELTSSRYGNIGRPAWSPDGKWIAYSKPDQTRNGEIYLLPSAGGEERKATFDSFSDLNPQFTPDGRKLYFVRSEGLTGATPSAQIYSMSLEREERDPNDPEERPEPAEGQEQAGEGGQPGRSRAMAQRNQPPREINIDWSGLKRRTRQLTRMPFAAFNYAIAPDGKTIAFVTTEPSSTSTLPVVYSIQEDGKRLTRIVSGGAPGEGAGGGGGGGFGAGISGLGFSCDGRTLFYREGNGVYSISMPPAGPSAAMAGSGGREGARKRISFTAKVKIDKPAEWAEMFDDAWRTMKYRFYDAEMHGKDWDAMRAKYQPLVEYVADRQELLNIVNEMIGELNASHTGAAPPPASRAGGVSTSHLGFELEADSQANRYRVTHVYEDGPADKDWVKVSAGDYLIAIDGKPVKAGDNYWELLNSLLNRKVEVTLNNKPAEEGSWKARIEPVSTAAYSQLRYERWVKDRRAMVEKLSGGRVGYVHIQAMNQPSLRRFEKELRENRDKEALVIDQRWNGGGNIEQ